MQGPQRCNPGRSWLANRTWLSHVRLGLEPDSSRSRCGHVGHEELNQAGTLCPKLKHRWIRSLDIWAMSRRNPSSLDSTSELRVPNVETGKQCRRVRHTRTQPLLRRSVTSPHPNTTSTAALYTYIVQAPRQPTQPSPENSPPLPPSHDCCVPRARVTRRGPTIPLELTCLGRASSPPCRTHDRVKL
jgi:hypothetical protein